MAKQKPMNKIVATVFMITAYVLTGIIIVLNKHILENVSVIQLNTLRFSMCMPLLILFLPAKPQKVPTRKMAELVFKGILNVFQFFLYYYGLQRLDATSTSVIAALTPLVIYFGAIRFLHEKARKRVLIGLIVALAGAIVVSLQGGEGGTKLDTIGLLAITGGVLLDALTVLITKDLAKTINPRIIMKTMFSIMVIGFWLLSFINNDFPNDISNTNMWLIFLSSVLMFISFIFYHSAIKKVNAENIGIISYLAPIVAVVSAMLFLGEQPEHAFWIGATLVVVGIVVAESNTHIKRHRHHHFSILRRH